MFEITLDAMQNPSRFEQLKNTKKLLLLIKGCNFHLVRFDEGLASHLELRLGSRGCVPTVAIEEWVGAVTAHGGRIPVLNHSRACADPTP